MAQDTGAIDCILTAVLGGGVTTDNEGIVVILETSAGPLNLACLPAEATRLNDAVTRLLAHRMGLGEEGGPSDPMVSTADSSSMPIGRSTVEAAADGRIVLQFEMSTGAFYRMDLSAGDAITLAEGLLSVARRPS